MVGEKRCLPHFRVGTSIDGGDSFPEILNNMERAMLKATNTA